MGRSKATNEDMDKIITFHELLKVRIEEEHHKQQAVTYYNKAMSEKWTFDDFYVKLISINGLEYKVQNVNEQVRQHSLQNQQGIAKPFSQTPSEPVYAGNYNMLQHQPISNNKNLNSGSIQTMVPRLNTEQSHQSIVHHKPFPAQSTVSKKPERAQSIAPPTNMNHSTDTLVRLNQGNMEKSGHSQTTHDQVQQIKPTNQKMENFQSHNNSVSNNPVSFFRMDNFNRLEAPISNHNYSYRNEPIQNSTNEANSILNLSRLRKRFDQRNYNPQCMLVIESAVNDYMQSIVKEIISVFNISTESPDISERKHIKKYYNFYNDIDFDKRKDVKKYESKNVSNPLQEYNRQCQEDKLCKQNLESQILNYFRKDVNKDGKAISTISFVKPDKKSSVQETECFEIYKVLAKTYVDKVKNTDDTENFTKEQNKCIELFIGNKHNPNKPKHILDNGILKKRTEAELKISQESVMNNENFNCVKMKHLIFFLENNYRFKKSNILFRAYTVSEKIKI